MNMNVCIAVFLFSLLIGLGNILLFIQPIYYGLIPIMFIYLCIGKLLYIEANCKSLEVKDFVYTIGFVIICMLYFILCNITFQVSQISYLLLISFITIIVFADSIRFKSLVS